MSFLAPGRLWLAIIPIALAAAYVVLQRRRQQHAVRFSSVDLLASVMPKRSGWQRHVPTGLLLLSLLSLVVGFARPTKTINVESGKETGNRRGRSKKTGRPGA